MCAALTLHRPMVDGVVQDLDRFRLLLDYIIKVKLQAASEEHSVVFVHSAAQPAETPRALTKLFLEDLGVPTVDIRLAGSWKEGQQLTGSVGSFRSSTTKEEYDESGPAIADGRFS